MVSTLATEREAAPPVPETEAVHRLLATYQRLVEEGGRVRRDAPLPRRLVTAGAEHYAIEHVRRALALLERRYSAHAALAEHPAVEDEGRERVTRLAGSLPPPQSRWRTLALIAGILVAARAILAVVSDLGAPEGRGTKPLADALTRVTDLSLGNLGDAVEVVADTSLLTTSLVALVFTVAAVIVLRPLMTGVVAFRVLRHGHPGARWYRHERERASQLRVDEREAAVFAATGVRAPADPRLDLAVKTCLAAALLLVAIAFWRLFLSTELTASTSSLGTLEDGTGLSWRTADREPWQAAFAVVLGCAASLRLAWLGLEWRPGPDRWLMLGAVPVLAAVFALLAVPDNRSPAVMIVATPLSVTDAPERAAVVLRYACDEPCFTSHHRLSGFNEEPPRGLGALEVESTALHSPASPWQKALEAAERELPGFLDELGFQVPDEAFESDEILLSRGQAEWLRSVLDDPDTEEVYIDFRVADDHGNVTNMSVGVSPAQP